jgi:hypothetical protein
VGLALHGMQWNPGWATPATGAVLWNLHAMVVDSRATQHSAAPQLPLQHDTCATPDPAIKCRQLTCTSVDDPASAN